MDRMANKHDAEGGAAVAGAARGSAFLRVVIETHDSRLEMDTRKMTAKYIEARAIEAIRQGCVGLLISGSPNR